MGKRKQFAGIVISDKMQKTVVVRITHFSKHAKYGKILKRYSKYKVHDEKGIAKKGDFIRIVETRPLSKEKRFKVDEVLKKAEIITVSEETIDKEKVNDTAA